MISATKSRFVMARRRSYPRTRRVRDPSALESLLFDVFFESTAGRRRKRRDAARKASPDPLEANKVPAPVQKTESVSTLVGGIDEDIKRIFLSLTPAKLSNVLGRYGQKYGTSKLIYAKNTYPHWKSGRTVMSGIVVARLLNLVPAALDLDTRFELVRKLRKAYMRKERVEIACNPSNWFKKVPPIVDALIDYSNRFELPPEVIVKLEWLTDGDTMAVRDLLVAAEIDEANARAKFLTREYDRISRMVSNFNGTGVVNHVIELPQGTVSVTISRERVGLLQRLPIGIAKANNSKRVLSVVCKTPGCGAELETALTAYEGQPLICSPGEMTCDRCGATHNYRDADLSRTRKNLNAEIWKGLFGTYTVSYDCPHCSIRLKSLLEDAGNVDTCPKCGGQFEVPRR